MQLHLNHITLAVSDVERSFKFYKDVLKFKPLCKWHKGAYFLVGELWFCLNLDQNPIKRPDDTHIAFTVTEDEFEAAKNLLLEHGVTKYRDNTSEGASLYFLDPDGHKLEIHVGDWESRLKAKKHDVGQWQDVEFYV